MARKKELDNYECLIIKLKQTNALISTFEKYVWTRVDAWGGALERALHLKKKEERKKKIYKKFQF